MNLLFVSFTRLHTVLLLLGCASSGSKDQPEVAGVAKSI
jgi:hypothetical protein